MSSKAIKAFLIKMNELPQVMLRAMRMVQSVQFLICFADALNR